MILPADRFRALTKVLPILCVDVIVLDGRGRILLIKRLREPMKGRWWVIGGRVDKGEMLRKAARRKVLEETGVEVEILGPVGYYESLREKTDQGNGFRRHSVSVVFLAKIKSAPRVELDGQSASWKMSKTLPREFRIVPFAAASGNRRESPSRRKPCPKP